jgi:hypothetical protein
MGSGELGMHHWADPHSVSLLDFQGLRSCAVVFWTSLILSGLDVLLLTLGLRRQPRSALLTTELLLGLALLLAACALFSEFFAPYWPMDERALDALLKRSLTWREVGSYLACLGGLGLLCHFALSRRVCVRRALLWSTAPALFGAAVLYIGAP